ncbi:GntR family transcriptional regulator [Amycolatopsis thailandensis]|uniref:GntR family transcriptional regulator n=1 Tax=Amycolatopsis thailandensis TaxID=589330 RepID=UPI0036615F7D
MDGYDLSDPRPAYLRIATLVRDQIQLGDLKPGDQLPSMRALAEQYEVGVETIKRSLELLRAGGVIVSRQGKGSFVSERADDAPASLPPSAGIADQVDALRAELAGVKERLAQLEARVNES